MTCKHGKDDPNCSSHPSNVRREYQEQIRALEREVETRTPDKMKYEIVDFVRCGLNVVLKVKYPNCAKCAYEGNKVLVWLSVTEGEMMRWREIDPHFRDPKASRAPFQAPPPAARFPASEQGWRDAVDYARKKMT